MIRTALLSLALAAAASASGAPSAADLCIQHLDVGNCVATLAPATGAVTSGKACLGFPPAFAWSAMIDTEAGFLYGVGGGFPRQLVKLDLATGASVAAVQVGSSEQCPYALAPPAQAGGMPYALWFDQSRCPEATGGYCFVQLSVNATSVTPVPLQGAPDRLHGNDSCFPLGAQGFSQAGRTTADGSYATLWMCKESRTVAVVVSPFGGSRVIEVQGVEADLVLDFWASPNDGLMWVLVSLDGGHVAVREILSSGEVDEGNDFSVYNIPSTSTAVLAPVKGGFCVVVVPNDGSKGTTRVSCTYGGAPGSGDWYSRFLSNTVAGFGSSSQPYNSILAPVSCSA